MNDLNPYTSHRLNQLGLSERARKRWARHRGTRWLWEREQLSVAIGYVVDEQGYPMAVFEAAEP